MLSLQKSIYNLYRALEPSVPQHAPSSRFHVEWISEGHGAEKPTTALDPAIQLAMSASV